jgi:hypothetical protein
MPMHNQGALRRTSAVSTALRRRNPQRPHQAALARTARQRQGGGASSCGRHGTAAQRREERVGAAPVFYSLIANKPIRLLAPAGTCTRRQGFGGPAATFSMLRAFAGGTAPVYAPGCAGVRWEPLIALRGSGSIECRRLIHEGHYDLTKEAADDGTGQRFPNSFGLWRWNVGQRRWGGHAVARRGWPSLNVARCGSMGGAGVQRGCAEIRRARCDLTRCYFQQLCLSRRNHFS